MGHRFVVDPFPCENAVKHTFTYLFTEHTQINTLACMTMISYNVYSIHTMIYIYIYNEYIYIYNELSMYIYIYIYVFFYKMYSMHIL